MSLIRNCGNLANQDRLAASVHGNLLTRLQLADNDIDRCTRRAGTRTRIHGANKGNGRRDHGPPPTTVTAEVRMWQRRRFIHLVVIASSLIVKPPG